MVEKELNNETATDVDTTVDYIQALNELKQNSVDRSKYEALRADNKRLLDSIVNGQAAEMEIKTEPKKSVDELRKAVFKDESTNLQYWSNVLDLRDTLIENGERDPFLPYGQKILPTNEDIECANRVANVVRECIEYAEGDNEAFTNELQRRTVDTPYARRK